MLGKVTIGNDRRYEKAFAGANHSLETGDYLNKIKLSEVKPC